MTYKGIFELDPRKYEPGFVKAMYKHIAKRIRDHRRWIISDYRETVSQPGLSEADKNHFRRKVREALRAAPELAFGYQHQFLKQNQMLIWQ